MFEQPIHQDAIKPTTHEGCLQEFGYRSVLAAEMLCHQSAAARRTNRRSTAQRWQIGDSERRNEWCPNPHFPSFGQFLLAWITHELAHAASSCSTEANMTTPLELRIPADLTSHADEFSTLLSATALIVHVPNDYVAALAANTSIPEVVAIQRLITLARSGVKMSVKWDSRIGTQVFAAPPLFPLLAVLLCLDCADHHLTEANGTIKEVNVQQIRKTIHNFRPLTDLFADSQILICSDSRGYGRPKSLYNQDGTLLSRSDFEGLVERLLAAQIGLDVDTAQAVKFSQNVSTIIAELFENTEIHGKQDLRGIPFKYNGIRGILFKRIELPLLTLPKPTQVSNHEYRSVVDERRRTPPVALEISVFDSGAGFFGSYTRSQLSSDTPLLDEWKVVHKCLERHYDFDPLSLPPHHDTRLAHTGMGLYEVLRALQFLKGKFEVRSGRTYGFRTFLEGETQFLIEAATSARPGMPKPVLLDQGLKFVRFPTANELLVGSTVRVLVPLN